MPHYRTRAFAVATWLVFCLSSGRGAGGPPAVASDVVRARQFELIDAAGNARASLVAAANGATMLVMRDAAGKIRLNLSVASADAPLLLLLDAAGKTRA